ncbi:small integral membrane protein 8-like [Gigantopelta aegis]|uniref:small integral membrane protein 8-like n=1 Tax=Gigantopelta aegis TaxID=1735272 RepID=UPI001B889159|nr:small integral membrane protein 8-like [Gigantopelta aegis]
MSSEGDAPKPKDTASKSSKLKGLFEIQEPGWKQIKTTSVFRAVNFELYTRPNKVAMVFGVTAFLSCVGYMVYINYQDRKNHTYAAMNTDGTLTTRPKISRWD